MSIAHLIVDMQSIYIQEEHIEKKALDKACMYINYVSDLLRSKEYPVIHVQDTEGMQDANRGTYDVIPEIRIDDRDLRVTKRHPNAFWNTELEQLLRSRNVELVVVSGLAAEHCVLFTYNGAIERGFKSVILQNGILSSKSDVIASTYRDRNLISYPVIECFVQAKERA